MCRKDQALCCLLFLAAVLAVYGHLTDERLMFKLCKEDSLVEWSTFVFYLLAAYFFIVNNEGWRNVWRWMLALLCFFIAGEEVSWGQRLFGYATPDTVSALNVQHEFNFHNLQGMNGIVRSFGLLLFSVLCFAMPMTDHFFERCRRLYAKLRLPVFSIRAAVVVTFAMLLMAVPRLVFGMSVFNLDEMGELYLAIAMLLFSLDRMRV